MSGYGAIIHFCIWTSVALAAIFAALVCRRWITERREPATRSHQTAISRAYLQRIQGLQPDVINHHWTSNECMEAASHLLLLLRGGERETLVELAEQDGLLAGVLRRSHSWRAARRIDAIRILQQFGGELAEARLTAILGGDPHPIVRLNAAFALAQFGKLPPPRETMAMLGMPNRAPTRMDVAMLRAMAPEHAKELQDILFDIMPHARRAAIIDALGWSADPQVLPLLERAARFENVDIRCAALRAAAKLGNPSVRHWIIRALADEHPAVRTQAINSCASLALSDAEPALRLLAGDTDLWVRLRADEALHELAPEARLAGVA